EPMNFHELIEDIVVMLAPSAHNKGLELNYLYYDDAPKQILGDSLRLKQVITNLINNAVKFTDEGEIVIRVMLDDSLDSKLGNLKISVSDTGIGLSTSEQTSIFKAFSQADASTARQFGGTGLGLSICRGLVHEMGGEIDFESEPGNGATFWFTLPLDEELMAEQTDQHGGILGIDDSTLKQLQSLDCLLFELQQTSRRSIQHALAVTGVSVKVFDHLEALCDHTRHLTSPLQTLALLCLNEDQLNAPAVTQAVEEIQAQKVKVLLFTPTL
ncbi:ATP-binding protein, partial [Oleiphilus sp. HI0079]